MMKMEYRFAMFGILFMAFCLSVAGQMDDKLTLPNEVRLNNRQPPDTVLSAIGIKAGMMVGEVGAGRGRYTVHIASRVAPDGLVYANDIKAGDLQFLARRCKEHGLSNVKTVLGEVSETNLPDAALDLVVMVNVVHHLEKPVELLKNVGKSLKPGGIVVVVDGSLEKEPSGAGHWIPRSKHLKIYKDAGYKIFREETFLPKDSIYFLSAGD
jgi:ubiquinone/menaquinone biosynthesis C-methylase UbiE